MKPFFFQHILLRFLLLLSLFFFIGIVAPDAFAIVFPDDAIRFLEDSPKRRYPETSSLLAMTVGQVYSPRGFAVGTGVHIGSGKILIAYHLYVDYLADAEVKELHYRLRFSHCPSDRVQDCLTAFDDATIAYRFCDPAWDFCVFDVREPEQKARMANRHIFISTQKPTIDSEVITAGFPGSSSLFDDPKTSSGIMVDGERDTFATAERLRPRKLIPSYGFTVSGEKGISNSPVSLKSDPLFMVAYFWAVPAEHGLEKREAIRRYREGVSQREDINAIDFLLNWGVSADHIADSLLKSPLKNQFCFAGIDRIYACR